MLNKIYIDIDSEIMGMLCLEVNTEKREWKEKYFYQSNMYYDSKLSRILYSDVLNPRDPTLIVTFNGRKHDLGSRFNTFLEQCRILTEHSHKYKSKMLNRDRDLIDLCLKRGINIKSENKDNGKEKVIGEIWESGLWSTTDRLIGYFESKENGGADRKLEEKYRRARQNYYIAFTEAPTLWDYDIKRGYTDKNRYKWKNEADVRALPLLEESLELLYVPRTEEDKYCHKW